MSVKSSILAVLTMGECHGYQLRQEIEARTGGNLQVNLGQIYTTLERLERDGLVVAVETNVQGQTRYRNTVAGNDAAKIWLTTATDNAAEARNELAVKLALAVTIPGCDVAELVHVQRVQTMRTLQALTAAKRATDEADPAELPWLLVADRSIFNQEAELRWLDHIEGSLARANARGLSPSQELSEPTRRGRPAKTNQEN
jgi:DNA-binding PadR family transcriptional regulator